MQQFTTALPWSTMAIADIPSSLVFDVSKLELHGRPAVLDVGCGTGTVSRAVAKRGAKVSIGIDINREAIDFGLKDAPPNCRLLVGDALSLPLGDSRFDLVLATAFLTTILSRRDRVTALSEARRVLSPDGTLWIRDFARSDHLQPYKDRYRAAADMGYEPGTFPVIQDGSIQYYAHHYTKSEISDLLVETGFSPAHFSYIPAKSYHHHDVLSFLVSATPT